MGKVSERSQHDNPLLEPIAICGMACRGPGDAVSPSALWQMFVNKESGHSDRVPKSRFNIDAYYHPDLERPGSFNVSGGYFLDGRPEDFDPTAFNMSPIEAQWLDPQQRKILEVTYECLESAGLPLEVVSGSNTAVFVGSFTSDYQQMSTREPDFRHNYAATGVDPGLISNRVGNVFNLNGPSFTINTACSSSIYAIHIACLALRARDCDAAIAAGVNLILTVDQHMNTAKLGILSPTSTCHTFDASADGYGRAEGVGAVYLKRLPDAIRDGDIIRGVIRSSAINTNGKAEGVGITHPSGSGQERAVRMAYKKAGLRPDDTAYTELHGTGTPVGDPIEVKAIASAMNDKRPVDVPLLIGAVKPNIGHSEAASGIFAVMKAAMMTEAGIIPGVAHFKELNPAIQTDEWNVKVNTDTTPWPKGSRVRRAGVSSFGYGGTNGHVVVESINNLYPWYEHAKRKDEVSHNTFSTRPFLLCFTAHDKPTLMRNVAAIGKIAADYYMTDFAFTLNQNRTKWGHRAFSIACDESEPDVFNLPSLHTGSVLPAVPEVGFLFTGQGAQWIGMARMAIETFPSFRRCIQKLDGILARFKLAPMPQLQQIIFDEVNINEPQISQVTCTAIQIALVDLFGQWGIVPSVNLGHSSGEIAAGYAAGLISAPEAILSALCRGKIVNSNLLRGSMLAVGMGREEIHEWLSSYTEEQLCIACENSPGSVTLSGLPEHVTSMAEKLNAAGIFARELPTGRAYHSPQMAALSSSYEETLSLALEKLTAEDLAWRRPRSAMVSSVTGHLVDDSTTTLSPSYWSENLKSRVNFRGAVEDLGNNPDFGRVKIFIEIGPHSALSGPFKQTCTGNKFDYQYIPSMVRNKDDGTQLLSVAGSLFIAGYPVDLDMVNTPDSTLCRDYRKPRCSRLIPDLPPYQWNYDKTYWAEPRASAEQRALAHPRHDLLGRQITGLSSRARVWKNVLRHRDIPWLKDHTLGGTPIFPAAGYLCLAIESLRQVCDFEDIDFDGVRLRDIEISAALTIPDSDSNVEIQTRLESSPENSGESIWYSFFVESLAGDSWTLHCRGKISTTRDQNRQGQRGIHSLVPKPIDSTKVMHSVPGKRWYEGFQRVGFDYGKSFQLLEDVQSGYDSHDVTGTVKVVNQSHLMECESRYIIHPSTIDTCLQLIIISIHGGKYKTMPWGVVPVRIREVTLCFPHDDEGCNGDGVAWTGSLHGRNFTSSTYLIGRSGRALLTINDLHSVAYEAAVPAQPAPSLTYSGPFSTESWKPDVSRLKHSGLSGVLPRTATESEMLDIIVRLIHHKRPVNGAILCGTLEQETVQSIESVLKKENITIFSCNDVSMSDERISHDVPTILAMPGSSEDLAVAFPSTVDLVIADDHVPHDFETLKTLVSDDGWLVYYGSKSREGAAGATPPMAPGSSIEVLFWDPVKGARCLRVVSLRQSNCLLTDNTTPCVDIVRLPSELENSSLGMHLEGAGFIISNRTLDALNGTDHSQAVVIDDMSGNLLVSLNSPLFESLKALICSGIPIIWLTKGVRQGISLHGGMVPGLLRVIRSEQAAARLIYLDIDEGEDIANVPKAISTLLPDVPVKDSGDETELWLHQGALHICRIVPNETLNASSSPSDKLQTQARPLPLGVRLNSNVVDGHLQFSPSQDSLPSLPTDSIQIQVLASEHRTTHDALIVIGGTVMRCGSSVDDAIHDDQVIAMTTEAFPTIIQTPVYARIRPSPCSLASLVADVSVLVKIQNIQRTVERIGRNERIIVLPGPSGIVHMLIRLAAVSPWDITIVTDSTKEQENIVSSLAVGGNTVIHSSDWDAISTALTCRNDRLTIIAHDFSSLSQEIWRNLPSKSCFVLAECVPDAPVDPGPFSRDALFIPVSIKNLDAGSLTYLLRQSTEILQGNPQLAGHLVHVHDISEAGNTSRVTHDGASIPVFNYRYNESLVRIHPSNNRLRLYSDANYLLVGCLGGLGRSVSKLMLAHGARHFVFLSRSGAAKPEAAQTIKQLEAAGAITQVIQVDITSETEIDQVVAEVNTQRPIRGVIQAAMVLSDAMFEQMDYSSFLAAIKPKVHGTLNLSNAIRHLNVDFFVMTSSISATLGNPGQSNYSAANAFMDNLARHHRLHGRQAVSLVLPMVLDVGTVAENEGIESSLRRKGMYGIDEAEMLRGFAVAMTSSSDRLGVDIHDAGDSQIIIGLEPSELARAMTANETVDAYWYHDARLKHVRSSVETIGHTLSSSTGNSGPGAGSLDFLKDSSGASEEVIPLVAQHVASRVSSILLIPVEGIDLDGPSVASYGLDSMVGAELRNWLFKEFGLDYSFQELLSPSLTFCGLAKIIASHLGIEVEEYKSIT